MDKVKTIERFGSVRRAMFRVAMKRMKAMKVAPRQAVAIHMVAQRGECSMTELAKASDSDLAAVSRMISSLVRSGWFIRSNHPRDARQSIIRLSPKAKRKATDLENLISDMTDVFLGALSETEVEALHNILEKMDNSLAQIEADLG